MNMKCVAGWVVTRDTAPTTMRKTKSNQRSIRKKVWWTQAGIQEHFSKTIPVLYRTSHSCAEQMFDKLYSFSSLNKRALKAVWASFCFHGVCCGTTRIVSAFYHFILKFLTLKLNLRIREMCLKSFNSQSLTKHINSWILKIDRETTRQLYYNDDPSRSTACCSIQMVRSSLKAF